MKKLIGIAIFAIVIVVIATTALARCGWSRSSGRHNYRGQRAYKECPYAGLSRSEKFDTFDTNEDRYLKPAEFHGVQQAFSRIDTNNDDLISYREWRSCEDKWLRCDGDWCHGRVSKQNGSTQDRGTRGHCRW